jgi:ABC-2 type transport system permease protein
VIAGSIADRVVRAFGVDPMQWRALVVTALRVDLRTTGAMSLSRSGPSNGARSLAGFIVSLLLMSFVLMLFVAFTQDLFFSLTIYFSFLTFSIASSLLLEFQSIVLSPDDHRQLAYHPIDSRTFFAARLTSVLIYVGIMTASLGMPTALACVIAPHGGLHVALAVGLASIVAAITTAFLAIGAYVLLLHHVSTTRLSRALTYLQLSATFLVYGSYLALPRLIGEGLRTGRIVNPDGWILVLPGTWFASYAGIVTGTASAMHIALAALTLVILAISVSLTAGRVSLEYADRLALLASSTASRPGGISRSVRSGWIFRDGERRAIALLVRALFRHDMKFRLGVLTIVPLTIVYLFAGRSTNIVTDPFVSPPGNEPQFVYFAILFFPSMLRHALSKSDAWRAAWILHATPANSARLVLGLKDFVLLMFVVPYLVFLGLLIGWGFERFAHLVVLLVTLGLLTHLLAMCELCISPELPFSQPAAKGSRTRDMLILIAVVSLLAPLMPLLLHMAFATPVRVVGTLGGLVLANAVLVWATARRVHRMANAAEFQF